MPLKRKLSITSRSLQIAQNSSKEKEEKQSRTAPSPPQFRASAQATSSSPGTIPLGAMRREHPVLKPKGLRSGTKAWRLKTTNGIRPREAVTGARGGSGRLLAIEYTDEAVVVGVGKLPRGEEPLLCRRSNHQQPPP